MTRNQAIDLAQVHTDATNQPHIVWRTAIGYVWDSIEHAPSLTPNAVVLYPRERDIVSNVPPQSCPQCIEG